MKKIFFLFITLCLAHMGFAQLKVNNVGNAGIGVTPSTKAKLLLYNELASDTAFGLRSTNKLRELYPKTGGILYGTYLDNANTAYISTNYGVYTNNNIGGYSNDTYGYYAKNTASGYGGSIYGFYADNISNHSYSGSLYGIYLNNNTNSYSGNVYGIYSANIGSSSGSIYGIYTTVSGGSASYRYSGYFSGGKFIVMNGNVGIGRDNPAYLLDVNGTIRVGSTLYSSDERLKSDIKPLTDEKDKLYLLQGKSYKKAPLPSGLKDSLSVAEKAGRNEKIDENPEYGYLAQELKEIFPDLVSQDSAGYYSVNYIGLIPVIVEALKEQRSEIEKQREQIKQLVKLADIKSIDRKAFEANGIESIPMLLQNTPNPFNKTTEIGYFIPETVGNADIYIYDINGLQQKNISVAERGNGVTLLQATELQAGIYFYTLICDGKPVDTKQMILTR
ncbi:MAG: tail fiber domain-containing protein [Prevotellaceae bacterium]|jgi:hypothetical protein|nr:tail fiber domain-containing protein [Prevotellaceae bacterium]